jgi:hypothetical protein
MVASKLWLASCLLSRALSLCGRTPSARRGETAEQIGLGGGGQGFQLIVQLTAACADVDDRGGHAEGAGGKLGRQAVVKLEGGRGPRCDHSADDRLVVGRLPPGDDAEADVPTHYCWTPVPARSASHGKHVGFNAIGHEAECAAAALFGERRRDFYRRGLRIGIDRQGCPKAFSLVIFRPLPMAHQRPQSLSKQMPRRCLYRSAGKRPLPPSENTLLHI